MSHKQGLLLAGLLLSCALPCSAEGPKPISISTGQNSPFEVFYHRVENNMSAGAFAGLIGVAIQEGAAGKNDASKTREIMPKLLTPDCNPGITRAMTDALVAGGLAVNEGDGNPRAALFIQECGLRLVDRTTDEVAAFVFLRVEYSPAGAAKPAWKEDISITGKQRHKYSDFAGQDGLAQREMEETLKRAGTRAANKVIYQK